MMRSWRSVGTVLLIAMVGAIPVSAQRGAARGNRAAQLRRQIEQVFMQQARNQLGLTAEQATRVQEIVGQFAGTRLDLDVQERALTTALRGQLRPGIAADGDSVSKLVAALNANRVANAQSFQNEMNALARVLTPVQLGEFQLLNDRLLERIRQLQQQQAAAPPGRLGGDALPPPDSGALAGH
jgi:Spy/CpxP family protein refolding chaperone